MSAYEAAAIAYQQRAEENGVYSPKALAYYAQRPYISPNLPVSQLIQYQQGRQQATLARDIGMAENEYATSQAGKKYNIDRSILEKTYNEHLIPQMNEDFRLKGNQVHVPFAQRGMLQSGMAEAARGEFGTQKDFAFDQAAFDQQNKLGLLDFEYQDQIGGLAIQKMGLARTYNEAMSQIDAQEAAARYDLAAQIRAFS